MFEAWQQDYIAKYFKFDVVAYDFQLTLLALVVQSKAHENSFFHHLYRYKRN